MCNMNLHDSCADSIATRVLDDSALESFRHVHMDLLADLRNRLPPTCATKWMDAMTRLPCMGTSHARASASSSSSTSQRACQLQLVWHVGSISRCRSEWHRGTSHSKPHTCHTSAVACACFARLDNPPRPPAVLCPFCSRMVRAASQGNQLGCMLLQFDRRCLCSRVCVCVRMCIS